MLSFLTACAAPFLFVFMRYSTRLVLISSLLVLCSVLALFVFKRHSACHCSLLVHCLSFSQPFPFRYHCSLFVTAVSFSSLIQKGFVTVILLLSLLNRVRHRFIRQIRSIGT
ncbi:hypothetical protein BDB00DRAFT_58131 [Zychaea mexicana]|uniref:uncharacterized protein n=1 Tax=Zychaea mexicana TaxID=64656 RepID=UPI0022FF1B75|nr:uncharacterized protein BDB00DRAFT_58131 [Zychaea mexicana]KAI9488281.1 hypothetical protein BDB00DRAFT_58131 [Zychaea mexicana]